MSTPRRAGHLSPAIEHASALAETEIARAARGLGVLVSGLRIRIDVPEVWRVLGVVAQANAYADGRPIRVQVIGESVEAAGKRLVERSRERLIEAAGGWSARVWPDPAVIRQPTSPLVPRDRGRIARTKTVTPVPSHVQVAAATMDVLDYDAHLFTDAETGEHALIYRGGPAGYRLARLRPAAPPHPGALRLVTDPWPAPTMTPDAATARLNASTLPFLLFADAATGAARLIYRRYDGDYSLLIPASEVSNAERAAA